jgi:hypothetical protein
MSQLSTHYRSDDNRGITNTTRDYLDCNYLSNIENLYCTNPKLLVVFSGGNAVGKTTFARKIEKTMQGLVLENDAIRHSLLKLDPKFSKDTINRLSWQYSMDLYQRLDKVTSNGLIVRDGIIDWYFDRILPIFEKAGYAKFIVGFDVSRPKAIELIHVRGNTPLLPEQQFYELIDEHNLHIKRFRNAYTPDIVLGDDDLFNFDLVLAGIKVKLAGMQT